MLDYPKTKDCDRIISWVDMKKPKPPEYWVYIDADTIIKLYEYQTGRVVPIEKAEAITKNIKGKLVVAEGSVEVQRTKVFPVRPRRLFGFIEELLHRKYPDLQTSDLLDQTNRQKYGWLKGELTASLRDGHLEVGLRAEFKEDSELLIKLVANFDYFFPFYASMLTEKEGLCVRDAQMLAFMPSQSDARLGSKIVTIPIVITAIGKEQ